MGVSFVVCVSDSILCPVGTRQLKSELCSSVNRKEGLRCRVVAPRGGDLRPYGCVPSMFPPTMNLSGMVSFRHRSFWSSGGGAWGRRVGADARATVCVHKQIDSDCKLRNQLTTPIDRPTRQRVGIHTGQRVGERYVEDEASVDAYSQRSERDGKKGQMGPTRAIRRQRGL